MAHDLNTWRSWSATNPCPVCGGHARGGFSEDTGHRCTGGYFPDRPDCIACSNNTEGRPSSTGRTYWFRISEPVTWDDTPAPSRPRSTGRRAPRHWGSGSEWPEGVPTSWSIAAAYPYHWCELDGSDATHLYDMVRFQAPPDWPHPGERKQFRPRRPSVFPGRWRWTLADVQRVPFRLPELRRGIAAGLRVVLVEGEKDALTGTERVPGAIFTTAPNGVAGFADMMERHAGGRWFQGIHTLDVILDRDEAGDRFAAHVHQHVVLPGIVKQARYWRTPLQAPGADLTDHFNAGLTPADMRPVHLRRPDGTAL